MNIRIFNYIVMGETKVNTDFIDFFYPIQKFGDDAGVIRMWIRDECIHQFGVNLSEFSVETQAA